MKVYSMIRVDRSTKNRIAQSRPKNLTFGKYVENLLDFKQKFDMKEKVGVSLPQAMHTNQSEPVSSDIGNNIQQTKL